MEVRTIKTCHGLQELILFDGAVVFSEGLDVYELREACQRSRGERSLVEQLNSLRLLLAMAEAPF